LKPAKALKFLIHEDRKKEQILKQQAIQLKRRENAVNPCSEPLKKCSDLLSK
jgi:hypothetical protein